MERCESCNRSFESADISVYRYGNRHTTNFACPNCGQEVAITEAVDDLNDAITSGEVLEVHRLFGCRDDRTLGEMIE